VAPPELELRQTGPEPSVPGVGAGQGVASPVPAADSPYWAFYAAVAAEQVAAWLPDLPQRVLDLSGGEGFLQQLLLGGHEVVSVRRSVDDAPQPVTGPGRLLPVVADTRTLDWLRPDSVDLVLAESRSLSRCLAAESTIEHLHRVMRPGGRLLLVVDSLGLGLARLADQGRWAELADLPAADVVLVPDEDGTITRCFWPEELQALLAETGFAVEWVRTRSVLTPATVERALAERGPGAMRTLVRTELTLSAEHEGGSAGLHLVVSARKPD
jgi:SAM-dependent methyltransferase